MSGGVYRVFRRRAINRVLLMVSRLFTTAQMLNTALALAEVIAFIDPDFLAVRASSQGRARVSPQAGHC